MLRKGIAVRRARTDNSHQSTEKRVRDKHTRWFWIIKMFRMFSIRYFEKGITNPCDLAAMLHALNNRKRRKPPAVSRGAFLLSSVNLRVQDWESYRSLSRIKKVFVKKIFMPRLCAAKLQHLNVAFPFPFLVWIGLDCVTCQRTVFRLWRNFGERKSPLAFEGSGINVPLVPVSSQPRHEKAGCKVS